MCFDVVVGASPCCSLPPELRLIILNKAFGSVCVDVKFVVHEKQLERETLVAVCDWTAEEDGDLSLVADEIVEVVDVDVEGGFSYGYCPETPGQHGWFPSQLVEKLSSRKLLPIRTIKKYKR
jgi:hypothetical protein